MLQLTWEVSSLAVASTAASIVLSTHFWWILRKRGSDYSDAFSFLTQPRPSDCRSSHVMFLQIGGEACTTCSAGDVATKSARVYAQKALAALCGAIAATCLMRLLLDACPAGPHQTFQHCEQNLHPVRPSVGGKCFSGCSRVSSGMRSSMHASVRVSTVGGPILLPSGLTPRRQTSDENEGERMREVDRISWSARDSCPALFEPVGKCRFLKPRVDETSETPTAALRKKPLVVLTHSFWSR